MTRFYTMILLVWGEKAYNRLYIIALLCAVFLLLYLLIGLVDKVHHNLYHYILFLCFALSNH